MGSLPGWEVRVLLLTLAALALRRLLRRRPRSLLTPLWWVYLLRLLLAEISCALHWWNPLVWTAAACLREDMEMACDELALRGADAGERRAYFEAMLHFAAGPAAAPCFGSTQAERRVRHMAALGDLPVPSAGADKFPPDGIFICKFPQMLYNSSTKATFGKGRWTAMDVEVLAVPGGTRGVQWRALLARTGLAADSDVEETALLWDGGTLIAAASRQGNVLKCIAVSPERQGEGLLSAVLTPLRQGAFRAGIRRLFLYTKPENEALFTPLLFWPVARTDRVLLMEDQRDGIRRFLTSLPAESWPEPVGAAVMHCDPFTLGHRYLIETAAASCGGVYVFVLSEDRGRFPAGDRLELVRRGTADLPNVRVLPTGPYLISQATFPTYFLPDRDRAAEIQCRLDIEIFLRRFVPRFGITRRYVGTEPLSPLTGKYNDALRAALPGRGVAVHEVPRLERAGVPVSASAVRAAAERGDWEAAEKLVPRTTLDYLIRFFD